jgi:hypothetical protein
MVKTPAPESLGISRNPGERVRPTTPLKGDGGDEKLGKHGSEATFSPILIGNNESPGQVGELQGATRLTERETPRFVNRGAFGTNE